MSETKSNFNLASMLNGAFAKVKNLETEVNQSIEAGRISITAHYDELKLAIAEADISTLDKIEAAFALGQHSCNPTPVHDPLVASVVDKSESSKIIQLPH